MGRQLIFEQMDKTEELAEVLATTELGVYLYMDYYEFPSGVFNLFETFPAGTLSVERVSEVLQERYEENVEFAKDWDESTNHAASVGIFIGYFDQDENFRVIVDKFYHYEE